MNLIHSQKERDSYRQAFVDLHDTFALPIVIWTAAEQVVVSTDPKYSAYYDNVPNSTTVVVPQSGEYKARIHYLNAQDLMRELGNLSADEQTKISLDLGGVRLRVSGDAKPFLDIATQITFNGESHTVFKRDRPHGLFDPTDWYDYILQRIP